MLHILYVPNVVELIALYNVQATCTDCCLTKLLKIMLVPDFFNKNLSHSFSPSNARRHFKCEIYNLDIEIVEKY